MITNTPSTKCGRVKSKDSMEDIPELGAIGKLVLNNDDIAGPSSSQTSCSILSDDEKTLQFLDDLRLEFSSPATKTCVKETLKSELHKNDLKQAFAKSSNITEHLVLLEKRLTHGIAASTARVEQMNREISAGNEEGGFKKKITKSKPISLFSYPYFRDTKGMCAPVNADTVIKERNGDLNAYFVSGRMWLDKEKSMLLKGVAANALFLALKPLKTKRDFLRSKLKDPNVTDEQLENFREEIEIIEEKMQEERMTPVKDLLKKVGEDKINWMTISATNMQGTRTEHECECMWKNYVSIFVNKSLFTEAEDQRLAKLANYYKEKDWDTVAKKLNTGRTAIQCFERYQLKLNKDINKKFWTPEEDAKLLTVINALKVDNFIPWNKVCLFMKARSRIQITTRYERTLCSNISRRKFSKEEDALLLATVKFFDGSWKKMESYFVGRPANSLRERYVNTLCPGLRIGGWSKAEDIELINSVRKWGYGKWSKIARDMPGRTDNMVFVRARQLWMYADKPKVRRRRLDSDDNDIELYSPEQITAKLKPAAPTKICSFRNSKLAEIRGTAYVTLFEAIKRVAPRIAIGLNPNDPDVGAHLTAPQMHALSRELHRMLEVTRAQERVEAEIVDDAEEEPDEKPWQPKYMTRFGRSTEEDVAVPEGIARNPDVPTNGNAEFPAFWADFDPADEELGIEINETYLAWLGEVMESQAIEYCRIFPDVVENDETIKKANPSDALALKCYINTLQKQFLCENVDATDTDPDLDASLATSVSDFVHQLPSERPGGILLVPPNFTTMMMSEVLEAVDQRLTASVTLIFGSYRYVQYLTSCTPEPARCRPCRGGQMGTNVEVQDWIYDMRRQLLIPDVTMIEDAKIQVNHQDGEEVSCYCDEILQSKKELALFEQRAFSLLFCPFFLSKAIPSKSALLKAIAADARQPYVRKHMARSRRHWKKRIKTEPLSPDDLPTKRKYVMKDYANIQPSRRSSRSSVIKRREIKVEVKSEDEDLDFDDSDVDRDWRPEFKAQTTSCKNHFNFSTPSDKNYSDDTSNHSQPIKVKRKRKSVVKRDCSRRKKQNYKSPTIIRAVRFDTSSSNQDNLDCSVRNSEPQFQRSSGNQVNSTELINVNDLRLGSTHIVRVSSDDYYSFCGYNKKTNNIEDCDLVAKDPVKGNSVRIKDENNLKKIHFVEMDSSGTAISEQCEYHVQQNGVECATSETRSAAVGVLTRPMKSEKGIENPNFESQIRSNDVSSAVQVKLKNCKKPKNSESKIKMISESRNFENVQVMWKPSEDSDSKLKAFMKNISEKYHIKLDNIWDLHKWSVENICDLWEELWDVSGVIHSKRFDQVLQTGVPMCDRPQWFTGARLNFAENLLRYRDDKVAIIAAGEDRETRVITYAEMYQETKRYAAAFKKCGLKKGDIVVCLMPNREEAMTAMLGTVSAGAIWTGALPVMGPEPVLNRFKQINPKFLITIDRFQQDREEKELLPKVKEIADGLPSLEKVIIVPSKKESKSKNISHIRKSCFLDEFLSLGADDLMPEIQFEQVGMSHPVFLSYTSGTTGKPKPLAHGSATILSSFRDIILHTNSERNGVWLSNSPVGWASWNIFACMHFLGTTLLLFEGSPYYITPTFLWDLVDEHRITNLFLAPSILDELEKRGYVPTSKHDLSSLKTIMAGGSVVKPQNYDFVYNKIKKDILFSSAYGSTELLGAAMIVDKSLPVHRGEITCPALGVHLQCIDDSDRVVEGELGELFLGKPTPSLPLGIWGDVDGSRYREAYFSRFKDKFGIGDLAVINPTTKGIIIYCRSDETLKPNGCRFGSSEIYNIVNQFAEVYDSLCVSQYSRNKSERALLFLKMREPPLDPRLVPRIRKAIAEALSPRHVPEIIVEAPDIPYNLNGKKMEVTVKRLINKMPYNVETIRNKECLDFFHEVPPYQD